MNDFGRRLPGDRPVHFVLHSLEEPDALRLGGIVLNAGGVNVGDFLARACLKTTGGAVFGQKARMARRDEREYPLWVFD